MTCATWRMHSTGTSQPVETQDVFFWRLAGRSAPTGLANVHWIGCITAIKQEGQRCPKRRVAQAAIRLVTAVITFRNKERNVRSPS